MTLNGAHVNVLACARPSQTDSGRSLVFAAPASRNLLNASYASKLRRCGSYLWQPTVLPHSLERWLQRQPLAFRAALWGTGFGNVQSQIGIVGAWFRQCLCERTSELARQAPRT